MQNQKWYLQPIIYTLPLTSSTLARQVLHLIFASPDHAPVNLQKTFFLIA